MLISLSGNYTFAVSCDDNCEVWLSNSTDEHSTKKIVYVGTKEEPANTEVGDFKRFSSQISNEIHLEAGKKYFIEALHKQAAFKDHFLLAWLAPGWVRVKTIAGDDISSYMSLENIADVNDIADYIPETLVSHQSLLNNSSMENIYNFNQSVHKFGSPDDRDKFHLIPLVNQTDFDGLLPQIDYQPSYLVDFVPERYEGVHLVHETAVYPNDNTELTHMLAYQDCFYRRHASSYLPSLNVKRFNGKFIPFVSNTLQSVKEPLKFLTTTSKSLSSKDESFRDSNKQHSAKDYYTNKVKHSFYGRKLLDISINISHTRNMSNADLNFDISNMVSPTETYTIIPSNSSKLWSGTYGFSPVIPLKPSEFSNFSHVKPLTRNLSNFRRPNFDNRVLKKINQKVFFRNGKSDNFSFVNNLEMIRMYDVFGPAVHYLRRVVDRGLKYIYSSVHSTCKSDGNLILSTEVIFF